MKKQKWDRTTDRNSQYYKLRQGDKWFSGMSHIDAVEYIETGNVDILTKYKIN